MPIKKICLTLVLPVLCGCVSSSTRNQGSVLSEEYNRPAPPRVVPYVAPPAAHGQPYTPPVQPVEVTGREIRPVDPVVQVSEPDAVAIDYKLLAAIEQEIFALLFCRGGDTRWPVVVGFFQCQCEGEFPARDGR